MEGFSVESISQLPDDLKTGEAENFVQPELALIRLGDKKPIIEKRIRKIKD